ncbi:hypothetical protein [Cellulomonas dongxiuzhuiae]|uniref:Uncharacterized protein n=1 Tax=Cellulomonas dongxiuzhuiae TaxID=2819979 RepID=A0ABX8GK31_9CELL|nr:hypothetical protein [Cellulomonas dongxiuzhuiae]MBO3089356.1 hypothetical protein [Cellulomonas dongxiuzhuiae]MBO3094858.1 hypothetical protein [Cellulomonas dongxiuzhuiae]QWC15891.1 hypothetical protein KKR89_16800 [Cellulomonas dongxiuzhuiae]
MSPALVVPDVTWTWAWVPATDTPGDQLADWLTATAEQLAAWTDGPDVASLPVELRAEAQAEMTPQAIGRATALWLCGRAAECPAGVRVVWGAGFVAEADRPLWAPIPVAVEFRTPVADDPTYLMDTVGTRGSEGDGRPPVVDYVTTAAGDGVRVAALVREPGGVASCRVDAALRAEVPAYGDRPASSVDVVLSTWTDDLGLAGALGEGVADLMQRVATLLLPGEDGVPGIVLENEERSVP